MRIITFALFTILFFGFSTIVQAQPYTLDKTVKPVPLKLAELKDGSGALWAAADGTLGKTPHYMYVNGMSPHRMHSAVLVTQGNQILKLEIAKNTWNAPQKTCETKTNVDCNIDFRVSGSAGFKISGPSKTKYHFALLASPEHDIEETLPSPITR